jgi:predicted nucleic acid-binding protein
MTFDDLTIGSSIFLDSNLLVYYFAPDPALRPACAGLIERIRRQELAGYTSTHLVLEMEHRLMIIEAMSLFGQPAQGMVRRLKRHPADVQRLSEFRKAIEAIPNLGIQLLTATPQLIHAGSIVSQQAGLLSSDSLAIAIMSEHGLSNLASHDADFDRVPWIRRFRPV